MIVGNRWLAFPFLLLLVSQVTAQQVASRFVHVELWPGGAPGATGTSDEDRPAIIPVLPAPANRNGTAVLICPGGGFMTRATDHEGVLASQWFKAQGITSFILRYRIRPLYEPQASLQDANRAMQFIRAHAEEYGIARDRVGIIGFSAGGELATGSAFSPIPADSSATDPVSRFSSRPDFVILSYGSAPMPSQMAGSPPPPVFMFCTVEDGGHVTGMARLIGDIRKAGGEVEAHFFARGEHGVGIASGDPVLGEWPNLMLNWMRSIGVLTGKRRVELNGLVKLDGKPLVRGMVVLTPVNQSTAAPVTIYITNTGTGDLGRFRVKRDQGPMPGVYRVEVRQDATRWMSNSRDPMIIEMAAKREGGTLSDENRRVWSDYVRKRDLSPSIEDQRIYRRKHPRDPHGYTVEIGDRPAQELLIEVFSR